MASLNVMVSGFGFVRDAPNIESVVFYVNIQQGGCNTWTVYRRYDSFLRLSSQLTMIYGYLPQCPPKCFDVRNPDSIERARLDLSMWLMQLIQHASIYQSQAFLEFISSDANIPPLGLQPHMQTTNRANNIGDMDMDDMFDSALDDLGNDEMRDDEVLGGGVFDYSKPLNQQNHPPTSTSPSGLLEHDDEEANAAEVATAASQLAAALRPKEKVQLEDFVMIKVIGKGSFGKVLLVRKRDTGLIYAMKVLRKENIIKRNQVEHTRTERHVLGYVRHPFIVGLNYAFQTSEKLYFVLDYCAGGELFFHLGKVQRFSEPRARFYAAEITLAIEYVHNLDIIYRDLKPENVLLDANGHIRLTDFGLSKEGIQDDFSGANSFCGTPEYLAPEILNRSGHGRAVDWWSLGALLYEMLTGLPPFYCRDRDRLFEKIRQGELTFPKYLSSAAKDLLTKLLERDPTRRLGTGPDDAGEIKNHAFFQAIEWDALALGQIPPPWRPSFSGALDTSQFDREFTSMPVVSPDNTPKNLSLRRANNNNGNGLHPTAAAGDLFQGFTYTEESHLEDSYLRRQQQDNVTTTTSTSSSSSMAAGGTHPRTTL